jgi:predicted glycosyltransferase
MRIFIDIGHPAHVHYFKNFIKMMSARGHVFFISSRDKEFAQGSKRIIGKLFYTFIADYRLLRKSIFFNPDVYLSFGSPYAAHVSWLLRKPHIAITDTEHAKLGIMSFRLFTKYIITSFYFKKNFGKNHFRFRGLIEWAYLNPKYFTADTKIFNLLGISENEKYVIIRFVRWNATHDIGHRGIELAYREKFVEVISKFAKVFISSEVPLPKSLESYRLNISIDKMHDALSFASLFIGESGTMSSEAALLGTPAINISTSAVGLGSFEELVKRGLMFVIPDNQLALDKAIELLTLKEYHDIFISKLEKIKSEYEDINEYLMKFLKMV